MPFIFPTITTNFHLFRFSFPFPFPFPPFPLARLIANCMLHSFSCCSPCVKTKLFSSFCLSLYGSCLWSSSAPPLRSLETTFNNILRKIWHLPRMCHTGIVHQVAHLDSMIVLMGVVYLGATLSAVVSATASAKISATTSAMVSATVSAKASVTTSATVSAKASATTSATASAMVPLPLSASVVQCVCSDYHLAHA